MKVKFSRHAKRRMALYGISEPTVRGVLRTLELSEGEHEIVKEVQALDHPLKVVVVVEGGTATVVTAYPFKKGRKYEGLLR